MIFAVIGFLVALPLAVYTLAAVFGLIDQTNKASAILDLTIRISLVFILLLAMPEGTGFLVAIAFLVVIGLHAAAFIGLRRAILPGRWITERHE